MKLIAYYRRLFLEAIQIFEPVWIEEKDVLLGYGWYKHNYPLIEKFQISNMHPNQPIITFTIVLPESYLDTKIYEEIKKYASKFDLSIVIVNRKLSLNAAMSTDNLQNSIMGFINQARGELINIVDRVDLMPKASELQPVVCGK